jgi:nicotinate-nucleotide adenylyltransferase
LDIELIREKAPALAGEKRRAHVAGCAREAIRLAERWGADTLKAEAAALLHDSTKKLGTAEQLKLCKQYGIITKSSDTDSPSVLHAITAAELGRREFSVPGEVAGAIRWHTTGRADMSLLEKIIYVADVIEETRSFDGVDKIRLAAYSDIDYAILLAAASAIRELCGRMSVIHPDTIEAYNFLLKKRQ